MLEMLTLCNARNKMICKIRWDRLPRHNSAIVVNSTCAWNRSLPRIWLMASTRKRDAAAERTPTTRNARTGLASIRVERLGELTKAIQIVGISMELRTEKEQRDMGGGESTCS